jgi:hypothetical protein
MGGGVMTLIARLTSEAATHELCLENGHYVLRTYVAAPAFEKQLTTLEAGRWVDCVRKCGGDLYVERGASLRPLLQGVEG